MSKARGEAQEDVYKTLIPVRDFSDKVFRKSAQSIKPHEHLSFMNKHLSKHMADQGGSIEVISGSNKIKVNRRKYYDVN